MSDGELKPCPFCGGTEIGHFVKVAKRKFLSFVCANCDAQGPAIEGNVQSAETWQDVIDRWNNRYPQESADV